MTDSKDQETATVIEYSPANILHPISVENLLTLELPERKRLLPWLPEGGQIMVVGKQGIGKTYFTLGLATALATGQPFLKWEAGEPAGVLLVDGEMALSVLRERIMRMLPGETPAPIDVVSHQIVWAETERDINLGIAEWQNAIHAYLAAHPKIRVVILDNLSCLLPTVAEDKRDDWALKVAPFLALFRRRGVAVVLVHHTGKGGGQRGTSSREDALDTSIILEEPPNYDPAEGAQFIVRFTKSRGCFGDDVSEFEACLTTDMDGLPSWSWKSVEMSTDDRLLVLVRDGIESVTEAAEEMDMRKGTISKAKKRLQKKGILQPGMLLKMAG